MTDTRFQPVDAPERETAKEPPKRWRNWYRAIAPFENTVGDFRAVGDVYPGTRIWPSRDVAEQVASEDRADPAYAAGRGLSEYLGAFPEGEQPKRQN